MGTHPSGPSTVAAGATAGTPLLAHIRDHPEVLGDALPAFGVDLPFLFKILSVRTALSIQSHPDKASARRLHAEAPQIYRDSNHKPEMAVALSDFEALCGFCPHEDIVAALQGVPELRACCGAAPSDALIASGPDTRRAALQAAFTALMTADEATVRASLSQMVARLEEVERGSGGAGAGLGPAELSPKERLVLRLNVQYPGDVGVFAVWFLNFITLREGEAMALAANEPHAYLSGEIVECMATSDNVIRAGLTPKLRDTDALCSSLTYSQGAPAVMGGEAGPPGTHLRVYRPPFEEFEVWRFAPPAGAKTELPPPRGPLLLLVQHGGGELMAGSGGGGRPISRGQVFFVPAGTALSVTAETDVVAWIAAPNGMGF